jgi:hypothetical protein
MKTKLTNRPVEQVMAAIRALDLEPIKLRVMDPELGEGWTREYAESIEHAYRNYLTVLAKHPEDLEDIVVSKDVDEFWHTHILHTMKYTEDCERVFGRYLHHNPDVGGRAPAEIERKAALVERTRRLYQQESAMCSAAIQAGTAAMCSAAIRAENAAMCSAAIRAVNAAMCSAAMRAEDAAMCSAAIRAENAAMCSAAIRPGNAAMCSAAIRTENAAMCSAAVRANSSARAIHMAA